MSVSLHVQSRRQLKSGRRSARRRAWDRRPMYSRSSRSVTCYVIQAKPMTVHQQGTRSLVWDL
jgi:hypothetical protein